MSRLKPWTIVIHALIPEEVDAEHVESGTREAMAELDLWRYGEVVAVPRQEPATS